MQNLLASRAMLAILRTGAWNANRKHKQETQEENQRHGVNIARVWVSLTEHASLKQITSLIGKARQAHYAFTVPSVDEGWRFLPCGRELEHSEVMKKFGEQISQSVDQFIAAYDDEVKSAPQRMGSLYRPEFFPPAHEVREKFLFKTEYYPVPEQGTWQGWLEASAKEAEEDLRERVRDAVVHCECTLKRVPCPCSSCKGSKSKTGNFKDSLIENIMELANIIPDLNMTGAADIAAVAVEARELAAMDPQTLRDNSGARSDAAARAARLAGLLRA